MPPNYTGSDKTWINTLKNVDAADDLMIVSKPKAEDAGKIDTPVPDKNDSPSESTPKSYTEDHGPLYALLTALSASTPSEKPVVDTTVKKRKDKRDKKEKHHSKDGKCTKENSKSKPQKSRDTSLLVEHDVSRDTTRTGDIFGDLLGEDIPKWGILNPTP